MGIFRDLAKSYSEHDCYSLAANISFFAILSLIPLLMITMSVTGFVLGSSHELFEGILSAVTDILPRGQEQLTENLNHIVSGRSQIGGAGIIFLLFIASLLFSSIEHALDRIFQSVKRRNFFHSKLISILLVFGFTFVFFLPTVVGFFQSALAQFDINVPLGDIITSKAFFVVMMVASFVTAIKIIPNNYVHAKFALVGGVVFAVGVSVARFVFRWYIAHSFERYNLIYGSLAVLVVSVLWIYYVANILLIASELVAVLQRRYGPCLNGTSGNQE